MNKAPIVLRDGPLLRSLLSAGQAALEDLRKRKAAKNPAA